MKNHAEPSRHTLASPVLRPHRPLCSLHAFWFTCKTSASRSRCSFGVHKENPINLRKRTSIEVVTSEFHTRNACFFTHPLKWHQSKVSGKNKNTEELKPVLHNGFTRAKSGVERLTLVISNDEKKNNSTGRLTERRGGTSGAISCVFKGSRGWSTQSNQEAKGNRFHEKRASLGLRVALPSHLQDVGAAFPRQVGAGWRRRGAFGTQSFATVSHVHRYLQKNKNKKLYRAFVFWIIISISLR